MKKIGGNERRVDLITNFREVIQDSDLDDLGYKGYLFTWSNRRFELLIVEERLDRVFYCKNWGSTVQELPMLYIETWSSDHYLIVMQVIGRGKKCRLL